MTRIPERMVQLFDARHVRHVDVLSLLLLGADCGWSIRSSGKGKAIAMTAYDGKTITIPSDSGLRESVYRNRAASIMTHRHPDAASLVSVVERNVSDFGLDPSHARILRDCAVKVQAAQVPDPTPEAVAAPPRRTRPAADPFPVVHVGLPTDDPATAEFPDPIPVAPATPRQEIPPVTITATVLDHTGTRYLVDEHPRNTPTGSGLTYPSSAVLERTWSDGTTDYRCRFDGCDFTHDRYMSVARHYGKAHASGRSPQPEPTGLDDPNRHVETRRDARVATLAAEILEAMDAGAMSAHEIAERIVDRRIENRVPPEPTVDLTPEQILARIALLVDRGQSSTLMAENEALTAALAEADARLAQMTANLSVLRDLMADLAPTAALEA